ncbi:ornithine cyclodeaminase family protein [Mediterraneibacter agrestimuris]|uniref:ornithine cyclodeaminase family protein n=1 Tax=Mediterraneibacter agrestimuris TaxID=2941333 RepID=UPI00203F70F0|nr:ornithine cyclodeaminase family protein [Mediterraneibacter agrestimuris]
MEETFLYLDRETVKQYLKPEDVIAVIKELWTHWKDGSVREGEHSFLPISADSENSFLHIPACLPVKGILGFKWIGIYRNPAPGFPFSHGNIVIVNDIETGSLKAIVSADDITPMRTAGGHGVVAARVLAKKQVRTLAVIGSGTQAVCGIEGFLTEFPEIQRVQINCRKKKRFEEIKKRFDGRAEFVYVEAGRKIGEGADIILAATNSPDILLWYDDVEKGTTIIAIDGFVDVDPALAHKADKWYVGNRITDIAEIVESHEMSHNVELDSADIKGEVAEVMAGMIPGRESDDEIIICTHMGSGTYDVACAWRAYQKALENGCGVELKL